MTILPKNIENYIKRSFPDKRMQRVVIWVMFLGFVGMLWIVTPAFAGVSSFLGYPEDTKETYTYILSGLSAKRTLDMCFSKSNIKHISEIVAIKDVIWLASLIGIVMIFINLLAKVMELMTQATLTTDRLIGLIGGMIIPILLIININLIIQGVNTAGGYVREQLEDYSLDAETTTNPRDLATMSTYGDYLTQFGGIDEGDLVNIVTFDDFFTYLINLVNDTDGPFEESEYYKLYSTIQSSSDFIKSTYYAKNIMTPEQYIMQRGLTILRDKGFDVEAYSKDMGMSCAEIIRTFGDWLRGDNDSLEGIGSHNIYVSSFNYTINNMTNEEYTAYIVKGLYDHIREVVNGELDPNGTFLEGYGNTVVNGFKDIGNSKNLFDGLFKIGKAVFWDTTIGGVIGGTVSKYGNDAIKLVLELIIIFADIGVRIGIMAACFGVFGRLIIYQMFLPVGIADIATEGIRSNGLRMIKLFFAVYIEMGLFYIVNRMGWFIFQLIIGQVNTTASLVVCFVAGGTGIRAMMKSCKGISERVMGV